ncbi:HipA domain-containing protein [Cellulosimicrobium sp. CUA-896]|uniref:HipA domain-containing protein n=1 Tax=Cellulosimicrobium sp. CUA-896 TaxID=1517881 RepID=UPI003510E380
MPRRHALRPRPRPRRRPATPPGGHRTSLGLNTRDPERKFQHGRALPSLARIARTLQDDGTRPDPLLALTTFNLAIGNTDAHAKNISVLRHADGTVRLAPAYDVSMHLHHPHASRVFAMDVAGERDMDALTGEHLVAEGASWGLPRRRAHRVVSQTLEALADALVAVDRSAHPRRRPARVAHRGAAHAGPAAKLPDA